jgi:hypothetical protein
MQQEVLMARKHPIVIEKSAKSLSPVPQAAWMESWRRSRGFEKQAAVIEILGSTGIGFLPKLRYRLAQRFGYPKDNVGNITSAIDNCAKRGLIEKTQAKGVGKGRPPMMVKLTEFGQSAYVMLTNQTPVPSELLALSGHMSDKHLILNLRAKQYLEKAGYEILADSYRYYLDGVRQAVPDITARKDGQVYYIEVERDTYKSERPEKWRNLNELSMGSLYVICETRYMMADLAFEVSEAMSPEMTAWTLHMTHFAQMENDLNAGQSDFWRDIMTFYVPDPDVDDEIDDGDSDDEADDLDLDDDDDWDSDDSDFDEPDGADEYLQEALHDPA